MKLMLVGYLENITSDRHIIITSGMRMDILYFLEYDLGDELPWHSTLSRTRKLYGQEQFVNLFKQVLKLCIDEGIISGKRQAVDSALIKANASKQDCANAKEFKKLIDSMDKHLYEYMQQRIESVKGKQMKLLSSSTVEPVLGSLINHTGLKQINTKGIKQANKCMRMAAAAHNLKKLLKYMFKPI